jgi:hypothetical protein
MNRIRLLNQSTTAPTTPDSDIAGQLRADMNRLKGEFYDLEHGKVDYQAMRDSQVYRDYVARSTLLRDFDLSTLDTRQDKLAFWINLYNTLVIHGIVELDIKESVKEIPGFFGRIGYVIGGETYTPDAIEHGILRANHRPYMRLFRSFGAKDPRRKYMIDPPDPRIHFTLVCASSSCPPINFYTAKDLDTQLEIAAKGFINGAEVNIVPEKNLLELSPIFRWYKADFGGDRQGILQTLLHYLDPGDFRDFVKQKGLRARIVWKNYDWRLNR